VKAPNVAPRARGQAGVGLVETMVGILIGMVVIVVIFNILSVAEGYKRATIGSSDAQITGLLSQFVTARDIGNGGAGITMSDSDMINCTKNEAGAVASTLSVAALDAAIRPIPVLISDGGGAGLADSFIAYNAGAAHVMWPVDFVASSAAGAAFTVQSPNGFTVPVPTAAAPYWVVVMVNDGSGRCKLVRVTNAVPDPTVPLTGKVTLTQDAATATTVAYPVAGPARLLNLGPQGLATRIQYDVATVVSAGQLDGTLRTTDLLVPVAVAPVPVAQNVVLMKAQYGIDTNADGIVDCWTPADASTCGDFTDIAVRGFTMAQLNRILAVRIGVVVRSDEPDLRLLADPLNTELQAESRALLSATRPPVVLFNCSANTTAACQNRVVVPAGPGGVSGGSNCQPAVICDYWRYRTYETVIPLRNAIYSASIPP
jgi:type IV pilus assembly protein PilW